MLFDIVKGELLTVERGFSFIEANSLLVRMAEDETSLVEALQLETVMRKLSLVAGEDSWTS